MKSYRRALRRHHRARLYRKRKGYQVNRGRGAVHKVMIDTPKRCSCMLCGNPRKYWKEPTIQEKRLCLVRDHGLDAA